MRLKSIGIIAAAIGIPTVTLGTGYAYYVNSPRYAVKEAIESIQIKDKATFDKRVDLDQVVASVTDQVIDIYISSPEFQQELEGNPFAGLAMGFISMFKPQVQAMVKQQVTSYFTSDTSPNSVNSQSGLKAVNYKIDRGRDTAVIHATASLDRCDKPFTIDVQMRRQPQWKVIEVQQIDNLIENCPSIRAELSPSTSEESLSGSAEPPAVNSTSNGSRITEPDSVVVSQEDFDSNTSIQDSSENTNAVIVGDSSSKNIRTGPGTEYGVQHVVYPGDSIQILEIAQDGGGYTWYKVHFPQSGAEGWIAAQLVELDDSSP